ncbi:MAG: hypothetical protein V1792_06120 [Pseudomonadota bacterium]
MGRIIDRYKAGKYFRKKCTSQGFIYEIDGKRMWAFTGTATTGRNHDGGGGLEGEMEVSP